MTFVSYRNSASLTVYTANKFQVLAGSIVVVFFIGWVKLLLVNRLVKRQEVVDEEKRLRIQELRKSGQLIETAKSYDIPFGVRAIQSGIQVDGIWQSHPATPTGKETNYLDLEAGSFDKESVGDVKRNSKSSVKAAVPLTTKPTSRQDIPYSDFKDPSNMDRPASSVNRTSYKPQRSSHLRYGSHGEYDVETLDHLEGRPGPQPKKKPHAQRPRGSRLDREPDSSSAADNERSSGTSDDSDATLSQVRDEVQRSREVMVKEPLIRHTDYLSPAKSASKSVTRGSYVDQNFRPEYLPIPTEYPRYESSDPFATPSSNSYEIARGPADIGTSDITEANRLVDEPIDDQSSPFVSGELHMNKSVRKVNSGFEVLPAGTFGSPSTLKGKEINYNNDDSGERRQSAKLQKRPRNSTSSRP